MVSLSLFLLRTEELRKRIPHATTGVAAAVVALALLVFLFLALSGVVEGGRPGILDSGIDKASYAAFMLAFVGFYGSWSANIFVSKVLDPLEIEDTRILVTMIISMALLVIGVTYSFILGSPW